HILSLRSFPTRRSSDLFEIVGSQKNTIRRNKVAILDLTQVTNHKFGYKHLDRLPRTNHRKLVLLCDLRLESTELALFAIVNDSGDRQSTRLNSSHVSNS